MQKLGDELKAPSIEEVVSMLRLLADHLTSKTKILFAPAGEVSYTVYALDSNIPWWEETPDQIKSKKIEIPLKPFFGMVIGYNEELDILVMWPAQ